MSTQVSESLGSRSAAESLLRLDSECDKHLDAGSIPPTLSQGPFGVFNIKCVQKRPKGPLFPVQDSGTPVLMEPITAVDEEEPVQEIARQHWSNDLIDPDLGGYDDDLDLDYADHQFVSNSQCFPNCLPLDFSFCDLGLAMGPVDDMLLTNTDTGPISALRASTDKHIGDESQYNSSAAQMIPPSLCTSSAGHGVAGPQGMPEQAQELLRYYKQHIAEQMSPMQAKRKSPWQILFLPCALETFAELTLWNHASHTRSAILYSLLANSAFRLVQTNEPGSSVSSWREIGNRHQESAKKHLRYALRTEMQGPDQAKYTDMLMAILATAMVSVSLRRSLSSFLILLIITSYSTVLTPSKYTCLMPSD